MRLRVKRLDIEADKPIVVMHEEDARRVGTYPGGRVELRHGDRTVVAIVNVTKRAVNPGEIGLYADTCEELDGGLDYVDVQPTSEPKSVMYIRKKLDGKHLSPGEIYEIIMDVVEERLTSAEAAAFVAASYIHGFNMDETVALTEAIVASGDIIEISKGPVVDKHCIGGVPNNRTTMLFVPIMASLGFYVPKTSSRAITSPAGTADTMEVLARVDLSADEIKEITESVGGVMAWGGGTRIAAADDKLIAIRRPLALDPRGMLLASIMAKKRAVSSDYVLIDIPVGPEAKLSSVRKADELAEQFVILGHRLGMKVRAVLTDGSAPVGRGVGPVLEAKDVLEILHGGGPEDLKKKAVELVAHMLEFVRGVPFDEGLKIAEGQIRSGEALRKMKEIIEAQDGDPDVRPEDLKPGKYSETIYAEKDGVVRYISNRGIASLARTAGAPFAKGAGVYIHVSRGQRVRKGDPLITVYAESEKLLRDALALNVSPVRIE
ncbi:MAG: phosphorylase [Candidatus Diapherotrites archaeon]|nr:phosphorylase [Candidatus Diapherotrites archaeon]